jgi:hypothetical protein
VFIEATKCVAQESVTVRSNHSRELRILFTHSWPSLSHHYLNVRMRSIPSLLVWSLDVATADCASTQRKGRQRTKNQQDCLRNTDKPMSHPCAIEDDFPTIYLILLPNSVPSESASIDQRGAGFDGVDLLVRFPSSQSSRADRETTPGTIQVVSAKVPTLVCRARRQVLNPNVRTKDWVGPN